MSLRLTIAAIVALGAGALTGPAASSAAPAPKELRVPGGIGAGLLVEPASHLFGDPVTASVEIVVDPKRVQPSSIRVRTSFEPYRLTAPLRIERRETRGLVSLRYVYRLLCLRAPCRPRPGRVKEFRFGPVQLVFVRANGTLRELSRTWFPLTVASRLLPDTALRAQVVARAQPFPSVDYRARPIRLARGLYALAALLALAGLLLLGRALAPLVRNALAQRRLVRLRPIERELALLRVGVARDQPELQRKALDSLALALGGNGTDDLAGSARQLAWSDRTLDSSAALELASEVERRLKQGARD